MKFILENTKLNYAAYFPVWDSRYVPAEGLGRMNLGNAIFSRYPITKASLTPQAQRSDIDGLTQTFYIQRGVGKAQIEVNQQSLAVYVVHTEAYDVDGTKEKQIKQIYQITSQETLPFLLGGDFNELPPNALRLKDFPDDLSQMESKVYYQRFIIVKKSIWNIKCMYAFFFCVNLDISF